MSVFPTGRLKSWLRNLKAPSEGPPVAKEMTSSETRSVDRWPNPLYEYYEQKFHDNPTSFTQFALQSRSRVIRDVFAIVATNGRNNLSELLVALERHNRAAADTDYDMEALLALAGLLANTARSDLDRHSAMIIFDFVSKLHGESRFSKEQKLQYLEVLNELARYEEVEYFSGLFEVDTLAPLQYELLNIQRIRQTTSDSSVWVDAMNRLYASVGLSEIELIGDESIALLDRLSAHTTKRISGPKVSIIMPTYSPGQGIWTAIRGLLEQTWQNIEVIIVDDASPSEYEELFSQLENTDERIRVVRQSQNLGAYVARNVGLSLAAGEYVTTHDDDDWSHPDKIAAQAEVLWKNETVIASTSAHIRTTQNMHLRRVNRRPAYLQKNYSSLMFRKKLIGEIGEWDSVNRSGDAEFVMRIITNFGSSSIVELSDWPLSFSRIWDGSLTSGEMARGFHAYSRILYRWAFRQWQLDTVKAGKKAVLNKNLPREFPMPTNFVPGARKTDLGLFDIIFVTDFFRQAKFVNTVLEQMATLYHQGLRVGFMHLASPQTIKPSGIPKRLFELQLQEIVTQVSHDDVARARALVVYDSSIGMFLDGVISSVSSDRSIVIDHRLPALAGQDEKIGSLMVQSLQHLDICFSTTFEVVGATPEDQQRLYGQVPLSRLLPDSMVWKPHISKKPSGISAPDGMPVVGFHTYGNIYRWPSNADIFKSVYVSSGYETRFFGNTGPAVSKFGRLLLDHAVNISRGECDETEFLEQIDFWVYYPHHRLQDQISLPVLSAMQAGKVVILPEHLEDLYGSAALYADPEEIDERVAQLASDPTAFKKQAQLGQDFVAEGYTADDLCARVCSLIGTTNRAA